MKFFYLMYDFCLKIYQLYMKRNYKIFIPYFLLGAVHKGRPHKLAKI